MTGEKRNKKPGIEFYSDIFLLSKDKQAFRLLIYYRW